MYSRFLRFFYSISCVAFWVLDNVCQLSEKSFADIDFHVLTEGGINP